MQLPFHSLYLHGFARVAVCVPSVEVANPHHNAESTLVLAERASALGAALAVFPELGLSAYSNEDLFHQEALLEATRDALRGVVKGSRDLPPLLLVGAALRLNDRLFNCAVAVHRGAILGITPKSYLPNYREFYEERQFAAARDAHFREVEWDGVAVPFGTDLVYTATGIDGLRVFPEICEDVWTPCPPSTFAALSGATVLANLSASNITVGKAEYRRQLCAGQSARCVAAYLYSAAGPGESTTDLAWDGHALIYENGSLLAESERFARDPQLITADIDLDRLVQDRMRLTSFHDSATDHRDRVAAFRRVRFNFTPPTSVLPLRRRVERFPFVPSESRARDERCYEVYNIQVHGLMKRLEASGSPRIVIGVSGGLDSAHALIVAARTMDRMEIPRSEIFAYTLPGYATSDRTLQNARALMEALGVRSHEIDIRPACDQILRDIGHPFAEGQPVYDVTFENVQAGQRTSHLFRLANHHHALVLGTGDLSELALGWCTYGVGDQMSHYNVNASVPKTLIQYVIRWVIQSGIFSDAANAVLQSVVETEISPELVPPGAHHRGGQPAQSTEAQIGPYPLQDFHLYYTTRFGFRPSKVAFLAHHAWGDAELGDWPDLLPNSSRSAYDLITIKKWLRVFLYRFFQTSQFKRSALPNGPKVGSGGSLSPRGDWRAPSDSSAEIWLREWETIPED